MQTPDVTTWIALCVLGIGIAVIFLLKEILFPPPYRRPKASSPAAKAGPFTACARCECEHYTEDLRKCALCGRIVCVECRWQRGFFICCYDCGQPGDFPTQGECEEATGPLFRK